METLLTKGKVETDMDHRIHFKIPNYCIGSTFDNSLVLIDESQQLPPLILKLLLERTGINSKVVITGDSTQLYVDVKIVTASEIVFHVFSVKINLEV